MDSVFLCFQYCFSPETGSWRHRAYLKGPSVKRLHEISYDNGKMEFNNTSNLYESGDVDLNVSLTI